MELIVLIIYIMTLSVLLLFGSQGFVLLFFRHKNKSKKPILTNPETSQKITVQLPIYNEYYVAERLINSICKLDYPKELLEIQVLDDSTDETVQLVEKVVNEKKELGFNIKQIRRSSREGFKAGALNEGLKLAESNLIAIFDADFVPQADFLKNIVGVFNDPSVGMVQTRWEHLNENYSLLTKIQAFSLNGHFVIEQSVRNQSGFFINFNGTGGMWRKECIEDAGGWEHDTLTEDLDLSYRAQLKGWKFVFYRDITCPAELPAEINAFKAQQFRWTKGGVETAKKILPLLWKSKVPLIVKIQGTFHLTGNMVFPFTLLTGILNVPLIFIKHAGNHDNIFKFMSVFILGFMSSFFFYLYAQKDINKNLKEIIKYFPLFMAGSMGLAVNNTRAVIEGLFNKKSEFVRTPKFAIQDKNDTWKDNKYMVPPAKKKTNLTAYVELGLGIYCFIGVVASIYFIELAALPFHMMFFFGFTTVSILSLKNSKIKINKTETKEEKEKKEKS